MDDLKWSDVIPRIPFVYWYNNSKRKRKRKFYFDVKSNTVVYHRVAFGYNGFFFSVDTMHVRYAETLRLTIGSLVVKNLTNDYNPSIAYDDVELSKDQFAYRECFILIKNNSLMSQYLKDMIDYDPHRVEFFKNPVDRINYITSCTNHGENVD